MVVGVGGWLPGGVGDFEFPVDAGGRFAVDVG